jgi:hypothetical protein
MLPFVTDELFLGEQMIPQDLVGHYTQVPKYLIKSFAHAMAYLAYLGTSE